MKSIPIARFGSRATAELLRERLAVAGIQAEIHESSGLEKIHFIAKGSAGARLEVPAEQFARAQQLLSDWDRAEGVLRDAIRCPECKSLHVDFPQFTHKSFTPNLLVGLFAEIGLLEKDFYCLDCHYAWPKEDPKPRAPRPHMAPYYFIEGIGPTELPQSKVEAESHRETA